MASLQLLWLYSALGPKRCSGWHASHRDGLYIYIYMSLSLSIHWSHCFAFCNFFVGLICLLLVTVVCFLLACVAILTTAIYTCVGVLWVMGNKLLHECTCRCYQWMGARLMEQRKSAISISHLLAGPLGALDHSNPFLVSLLLAQVGPKTLKMAPKDVPNTPR